MIFSFYLRQNADHQYEHAYALIDGLIKHGYACRFGYYDQIDVQSDVAVVWSWKQMRLIREMQRLNKPVLVMERGFFPIRNQWCALGINGLNGRGKYAPCGDSGERYNRFFKHLDKNISVKKDGYYLVIGQVTGDASLNGINPNVWAQDVVNGLKKRGKKAVFRPHPIEWDRAKRRHQTPFCPIGATLQSGLLEEAFLSASCVVTLSSNTAVESVLYGIPTIAMSDISIAYPICSHGLDDHFINDFDAKQKWCYDIAWRQWSLDELKNGDAVEHIKCLWTH